MIQPISFRINVVYCLPDALKYSGVGARRKHFILKVEGTLLRWHQGVGENTSLVITNHPLLFDSTMLVCHLAHAVASVLMKFLSVFVE